MRYKRGKDTQTNGKPKARCYYDACTLESRDVVSNMIRNKKIRLPLISHLAIGEAYGNSCCRVDDAKESFINLLDSLLEADCIEIVGNGISDKSFFEDILVTFTRMSVTDAMHLATAVQYKCDRFCTMDNDFVGLNKQTLRDLFQKHGLVEIAIDKIKSK